MGAALDNPDSYDFVLSLFYEDYEATTDIVEYFYINRPKGKEDFVCEMLDGEIVMSPANYLNGEIKRKVYNFVKNSPYDMYVHATSGGVVFQELYWSGEVKKAGSKVVFLYDKNVTNNLPYTKKYQLAENWTYGYFAGK